MSFYHNQHDFQVQPEKIKKLDEKICSPSFGPFGWNWRVEFIFICAVNFIFHVSPFSKSE